jgi:signal transduction histidine kinase
VAGADEIDILLDRLAQAARRATGALSVALSVVDHETGQLRARFDMEPAAAAAVQAAFGRYGLHPPRMAVPTDRPNLVNSSQSWEGPRTFGGSADVPGTAAPRELLDEVDRITGTKSLRVIPLRVHGTHVGIMTFASDAAQEPRELEMMDVWASQAALILQNAALARSLERRVEERTAALAEKTRELEALNAELRELDRAKSNFLATVSHELRTPLVSIQGYNELMLREALGPISSEQRRGLTIAVRNLALLVDLIDNLLYFARRELDVNEPPLATVDLRGVAENALDLQRPRAAQRGVQLVFEAPPERMSVRANQSELHRMVLNLVSNAIKFNKEADGCVRVTLRRAPEAHAELTVADNGIGIPPNEQERIFERFHQVDSSPTRRYGGAGIGLAVARAIARTHGGDIGVQSAAGGGSVFTVRLPLVT